MQQMNYPDRRGRCRRIRVRGVRGKKATRLHIYTARKAMAVGLAMELRKEPLVARSARQRSHVTPITPGDLGRGTSSSDGEALSSTSAATHASTRSPIDRDGAEA